MGLDMYLKLGEYHTISKDGKSIGEMGNIPLDWDEYDCSNLVEVLRNVCYWRKENAVHKFFVDKLADGKDDCSLLPCPKDVLRELRERCYKILNSLDGRVIRVPKSLVQHFKDLNDSLAPGKAKYIQRIKLSFPERNLEEFDKTIEKLNGYHRLSYTQDNVAKELLPTQDGFFFGPISYGGLYIMGLVRTIHMIDRALELAKKNGGSFYYEASW